MRYAGLYTGPGPEDSDTAVARNERGKESPRNENLGESPRSPPPERVTPGLYSVGPGVASRAGTGVWVLSGAAILEYLSEPSVVEADGGQNCQAKQMESCLVLLKGAGVTRQPGLPNEWFFSSVLTLRPVR